MTPYCLWSIGRSGRGVSGDSFDSVHAGFTLQSWTTQPFPRCRQKLPEPLPVRLSETPQASPSYHCAPLFDNKTEPWYHTCNFILLQIEVQCPSVRRKRAAEPVEPDRKGPLPKGLAACTAVAWSIGQQPPDCHPPFGWMERYRKEQVAACRVQIDRRSLMLPAVFVLSILSSVALRTGKEE